MLDYETRQHIKNEIDRRKREGWDAYSRRASTLSDDELLAALDGEWATTSQVAERLGLGRTMKPSLGRRLQSVEGVEVWRAAGSNNWTRYRLRKTPS